MRGDDSPLQPVRPRLPRGRDPPSSAPMTLLRPLRILCLVLGGVLTLLTVGAAPAPAKSKAKQLRERIEALPTPYQEWLESVQYLISEEEQELFLGLAEDYQRDAFIERFWKVRDPIRRTARNELRDDYELRVQDARQSFGSLEDERSQTLLMHGRPMQRLQVDCRLHLWPIEVWWYDGSDQVGFEFLMLFYQRFGTTWRAWEPFDGLEVLSRDQMSTQISREFIDERCGRDGEAVALAISFWMSQGSAMGAATLLARLKEKPESPNKEWVATFSTYTTDVPEDAAVFEAELEIDYPARRQSRTVLQAALAVPTEAIGLSEVGGHRSRELMMTGEILAEEALFENFRYQFSFPETEDPGDRLPLVFQRSLRPGNYEMILKVEDLATGAFHRSVHALEVPHLDEAPIPADIDPKTKAILEEATRAIRAGETTIQIAPLQGEWQTGLVRIPTLITGSGIDKVRFLLDDQPILTKRSPPYDVELDLGRVPRPRVLRVEAFDADGEEIAADEELLNAGQHRFAVRLVEPRRGKTYRRSLQAEVDVTIPEGEAVQKVDIFLNEDRVATLFQPPWTQPIVLPEAGEIAYVRALASTADGRTAEDLVFVNAPANLEEIDVDFVEVFATVLDREGRPIGDLGREDFRIVEDGTAQELLRFEQVRNLPIHVAVMLDVSASMEEELPTARDAALTFFQSSVRPKDRAAIVTFNDHPRLAAELTNDPEALAAGLAGIKAERGTSLWDSLIFSLYYFNGIKGQRAILVLSDGKDESSRFTWDEALEYAQRSGVALYTIGLQLERGPGDAKRSLRRLADETGGRSFFIEDVSELEGIYALIESELRSRYLLAYQSSNTSGSTRFREIEVEVDDDRSDEIKAMSGYYP